MNTVFRSLVHRFGVRTLGPQAGPRPSEILPERVKSSPARATGAVLAEAHLRRLEETKERYRLI